MTEYFLPLLIMLILMGLLLRENFIFTVAYLLAAAYALSLWWSRRSLANTACRRDYSPRIFLNQEIPVRLHLVNHGRLPALWVRVHDNLPVELKVPNFFQEVVSLGPREKLVLDYSVLGRKRGYYPLGPLSLQTGDLFGLGGRVLYEGQVDHLTVFPKIVPLFQASIPSRSPLGSLRHKEPIFEDPSRMRGKRDYVSGDSLRRIDWKATAVIGRMQVKLLEPSIALETLLALNLNREDYDRRVFYEATELAITVAASLANWIVGRRQSVGLLANGHDPLAEAGQSALIPARKGRQHLMRLLEVLARLQVVAGWPFTELLQSSIPQLSWGTTLVILTGRIDDALFDHLFRAQRAGLNTVLVACGPVPSLRESRQKAHRFGIPLYHFQTERDLDQWR